MDLTDDLIIQTSLFNCFCSGFRQVWYTLMKQLALAGATINNQLSMNIFYQFVLLWNLFSQNFVKDLLKNCLKYSLLDTVIFYYSRKIYFQKSNFSEFQSQNPIFWFNLIKLKDKYWGEVFANLSKELYR